jgi:hypothetical protein|tara:strand:- start:61 stop:342 length:282 start_codon:yes stop_codon:yes gene_type:complete
MWFGFKSGSLSCLKEEKFSRRKNWRVDDCEFYDYTAFKISGLIYELLDNDHDHPDLDMLSVILSMYMAGDVDVFWKEGYPMPYLKGEKFYDDF